MRLRELHREHQKTASAPIEELSSLMNRRELLRGSLAAALGLAVPSFVRGEENGAEKREMEKERIRAELDMQWKRLVREYDRRNEQHATRKKRIEHALDAKRWQSHVAALRREWGERASNLKPSHQHFTTLTLDDRFDTQRGLDRLLQRWERWEHLGFSDGDDDPGFSERIAGIVRERRALEYEYKWTLMQREDGTYMDLFPKEKERNPALTHERYFDMLAAQIQTPEELALFQRYFFWYTYDAPDPDRDPREKGTAKRYGEHWQRPWETAECTESGKMLGDCEDQALFLQEIVRRWGEKPFALYMTSHVTCVWIRQNADGRFDAYDLGTTGLNKNGNRFGIDDHSVITGVSYAPDPVHARGCTTPREALASVCAMYNTFDDAHLRQFTIENGIFIVDSAANSKREGEFRHVDPLRHVPLDRLSEHVRMQPPAVPPPPRER